MRLSSAKGMAEQADFIFVVGHKYGVDYMYMYIKNNAVTCININ